MTSRILVVDDDKAVRTAVKIILEHNGFDVVLAPDGASAIQAVETDEFSLIIVDIFMPGMDGLETIRTFKRRAPGVPVIAMSGFMFRDSAKPAPDFLAMATKLGAAQSLAKPFRPKDLLRAVECCLGDATGTTESRRRASGD
jgi:two-component system response regulator (stage 0 sporulation protein F)